MDYMKSATKEAYKGMRKGQGGPFGAIIIRKGKIISSAHNMVIKTNDPTAHAEIVAIRKATKKLKRFNLSDCEIYSTCEPCLMCFGAIEWAKIKKLYYGCTRKEAKMIGFDDEEIYADLKNAPKTKRLKEVRISSEETLGPFLELVKKRIKKKY